MRALCEANIYIYIYRERESLPHVEYHHTQAMQHSLDKNICGIYNMMITGMTLHGPCETTPMAIVISPFCDFISADIPRSRQHPDRASETK